MKVKVVKQRKKSEIDNLIQEFEEEYGSMESLQHMVLISKCSAPKQMNDYIVWKYLCSGAELQESIVFESADMFDVLSPKKAELLAFLANHEIASIRELAGSLHRNYKNVYDDLKSLSKYELVELRENGRALKPCCAVSQINVNFED